ncbi:glycerol-3-phosphate transporter [uncultured Barnesiella sp.]|uniref:glycerol-3-phosphate transporter n=1 Tax=uncultured Barnesiella sp. TaxID=584861 RepID=UPI002621D716|nr:glycerol-3-phosphate transporter [uncultured Barnesiella sp.]
MLKLFRPAPVIDPLPKEKVDKEYKKLRWQVFLGIFIGYAGYYLVRKNFSIAMPALEEMGFDKADLGWALSAVSIAYGISKFVMGTVSDHSNARVFIPLGLVASAVIMTVMGLIPWSVGSLSILFMFCILFVNGWVQGMGWPPCGRVMVHWFSARERGVKMSIWNVAHNIGGAVMAPLAVFGITLFGNWTGAFYFPAIVAVGVAAIAYLLVRDTPQSCGLPPIELYKPDECMQAYSAEQEKELSTREILFGHVFNNKLLWVIAFANAFIYFVRYGVLDWAPMYLEQVKHMDLANSSWSYFAFEIAGIFGTILCGWLSDKVFKGRRSPVTIIYMLLVMVAVYVYWNSASATVTNVAMAAIGFLIYGPVMLIGVSALDLVPKKAAGTAAGFTGLFGYLLGSAVFANIGMGYIFEHFGWDGGFFLLLGACAVTVVLMLFCKEDRAVNRR